MRSPVQPAGAAGARGGTRAAPPRGSVGGRAGRRRRHADALAAGFDEATGRLLVAAEHGGHDDFQGHGSSSGASLPGNGAPRKTARDPKRGAAHKFRRGAGSFPLNEKGFVVAALLLAISLAALDGTVVGTVMPTIIGQLGGLAYFSWAFSGYLLASPG